LDRGLVGVLLICLVGSSVGVLLFFGEKTRSSITILKVEYPERFTPGQPNRFAVNILARRDVEDLRVQYCFLYRVGGERIKELYQTEGFNQSVLSDDEPYRYLAIPRGTETMRKELPGEASFLTQRVTMPYEYVSRFVRKKVNLRIRYYDFSDMLRLVPSSAFPDVFTATTQFALVSIEEGNISLFQGRADYYLNREDSLSEMEIGKDETSQKYFNPRIVEVTGNYTHVDDAPPFGTVDFGALKRGQRAYLSFTTRDISLPAIQVVRFWVDGDLLEEETRFNLMGSPI